MSLEQHNVSGKRMDVNTFLQGAPAVISIVGRPVNSVSLLRVCPVAISAFFAGTRRGFCSQRVAKVRRALPLRNPVNRNRKSRFL